MYLGRGGLTRYLSGFYAVLLLCFQTVNNEIMILLQTVYPTVCYYMEIFSKNTIHQNKGRKSTSEHLLGMELWLLHEKINW